MPNAPEQLCTYNWTLRTDTGLHTCQSYFDLLPGQSNRIVFQAAGLRAQIGSSVTLCQDALWNRSNAERRRACDAPDQSARFSMFGRK